MIGEEAGVDASLKVAHPPRLILLTLAVLMMAAYTGMQLVFGAVLLLWVVVTHQPIVLEELAQSEPFIWVGLLSGAFGAVAAIGLAWIGPRVWHWMTSRNDGGAALWLSWSKPHRFGLWLVPLLTLPFMVLLVGSITRIFGDAEVDVQLLLFATPSLRIVSSIVVSTVVPLAEEFIFRGALYNALLPSMKEGVPEWLRQLLPLTVTSILFAMVHLLAGFETVAAIVEVAILSFYLGGLRAITGSVKSSVVGHFTWNLVGALVLATGLYLQ